MYRVVQKKLELGRQDSAFLVVYENWKHTGASEMLTVYFDVQYPWKEAHRNQ